MKNVTWKLKTGEIYKTFKAPKDSLPLEIATKIIEDVFLYKNKKKNIRVDILTFLSCNPKSKKDKMFPEYVFPTDVLLANASLYRHAEKMLQFRYEKTRELDK